jgi:dephospho-CoA kinase
MLVIGLIGGIASGKSFVAACFQELGAQILNADQIGHCVLENSNVIGSIRREWPDAVDAKGQVDRKILAEIVFRLPDRGSNLKKLESWTHPLIGQEIDRKLAELRMAGCQAVVLDAPVLLEAGWNSRCQKLVFIDAPLEQRKSRAFTRGWVADELETREGSQLSLQEKRSFATDFIHNGTSEQETRDQVRALWLSWGLPSPDRNQF